MKLLYHIFCLIDNDTVHRSRLILPALGRHKVVFNHYVGTFTRTLSPLVESQLIEHHGWKSLLPSLHLTKPALRQLMVILLVLTFWPTGITIMFWLNGIWSIDFWPNDASLKDNWPFRRWTLHNVLNWHDLILMSFPLLIQTLLHRLCLVPQKPNWSLIYSKWMIFHEQHKHYLRGWAVNQGNLPDGEDSIHLIKNRVQFFNASTH